MDRLVKDRKVIAIIQARMASTRLPAKSLLDLCGRTLVERVIDKVRESKRIDDIWLATSDEKSDDAIEAIGKKNKVNVYRGNHLDVLKRYVGAIKASGADIIVRVTGDNPLTEPRFIDLGVKALIMEDLDFFSYINIPHGSNTDIVTREAFFKANELTTNRNVVTLYITDHPNEFKVKKIDPPFVNLKRPDIRVTVDTLEDFLNMWSLFHKFKDKDVVQLEDAISFFDEKKRGVI
ncbi:MAG: cytidylyltransferase domain-containing protein [Candidatus Hodarchaeota archaeon]